MDIDLKDCKEHNYEELAGLAWQQKNRSTARAAQISIDLYGNYEPVHMTDALVDALADIRHACDLFNVSFSELDKKAHQEYMQFKSDHGVAGS